MSNTRKLRSVPTPPAASEWGGTFRRVEYVEHCAPDGLCIKARKNLTMRERDDYIDEAAEINAYQDSLTDEQSIEAGKVKDAPLHREMAQLAPFVIDWNVTAETEDGDEVAAPAPAELGIEAFYLISLDQYQWIAQTLNLAYRSGKGLMLFSGGKKRSEATAETGSLTSSDTPMTPSTDPDPDASPAPSATT